MTIQNVRVSIDSGVVCFYDIESICIDTVKFSPWDDLISITFQKSSKVYNYQYNKTFQEGFVSRVGTPKSLGSYVSLSLKELVRKN